MREAVLPSNAKSEGWFVVWTESRAEKKVAARIAGQGLEQWVPTVTRRRRWTDRWKEVAFPLFPGYLFAKATLASLPALLRTPGVLTVVKNGDRPAMLDQSFIVALKRAVEFRGIEAETLTERPTFAINDEVVVDEGPLSGLRGVVRQLRGKRYLVIWVEEIGRGVAFTVGENLVAPRSAAM
jgi:transcription termination/antitermination protein NusG